DGAASWHPATGRAAWSYSWTPNSSGPVTIMVRAADDSANIGAVVSRALNTGGGGPQVCPCTIWPSSAVPSVVTDSDAGSVELGVKFRASVDGTVTGVRFYKGPSNTGTHVGRLWSSTGTQLATVNFSGETASGWQQATFATPVAVTAGVTYVVSYVAPVGRYSANSGYFTGQGLSNPPLSALASGVDGLDGVYHYGSGFPTDSYQDTNYWVDVVFSTSTSTTTSTTTTTTSSSTTTTSVPTTTTTTLPTTTTTTTAPPPTCPCSIWRNNPTPGTPSDSDTSAVELGLKFRATRNGLVTGVRFYKGTGNTGTHVGNLWSSSGANLARINFTNETASGWQTATFSSPVSVVAGTTYVVSYFAPVGRYAGDADFFTSTGVSSPPLQALAAGVDGANGVYRYGTATAFPSSTYQSSNYWVDVVFS
ncbi:MAG: hypothetical protein QOJ23_5260, partial [Actinomycetota bacterium]|nr:hypothetical protein [Actinomycetota bacterium]